MATRFDLLKTHVYDKQNKCLDPIDNKCMCCEKGFSRSKNDNFYIPIYREKDRRGILIPPSRIVEFHRISVGVARCPNCKKIHKKAIWNSWFYPLVIGLGLFIVGLVLFLLLELKTIGVILMVLGIIAGVLLGLSKSMERERAFLEKMNVLSKEDAVRKYESVAELLRDGWSLYEPEP